MDEKLILAAVAVLSGLVVGALLGLVIRRGLDRPDRRTALREISSPLSVFVFWLIFAAGVLLAVGVGSPDRLENIPGDLLQWLPNLAVAGLLVIGGYALGVTAAAALGQTLQRVSGHRNHGLEQVVRVAVPAAAAILAFGQLGIDTTLINLLTSGLVATLTIALGGLSVLGGRHVAAQIAAGRSIRPLLSLGAVVRVAGREGTLRAMHATHVVLEVEEGHLFVPFAELHDHPFVVRSKPDPQQS